MGRAVRIFLGLLIFLGNAYSQAPAEMQDFDNLDPSMNERYERGSHLVYDCEGYFVCTKKEEFDYCLERRTSAITDLSVSLRCAPIESFKTDEECHKKQQDFTNEARRFLFCTHPEEKFLR